MNRHISYLLALFVLVALSACGHRATNAKRYELKGTVISVDRRGETVTIAHQEIPGYMEAMAMPFKPKDQWVLDQAQPGNRIQATLVIDGLRSWLEDVVITQETADNTATGSAAEPQPGDAMPDFTLTNQDGKRIALGDYRGRALVVTFIYTRCPVPDYCPLMTNHFAAISQAIKADAALYDKTHFLSVSVDPEYDTPKVLREYGAAHLGATDFRHWEFATGQAEAVKKFATWFGLQYWPEGGQIVHSLRTAVIGPDGKLVKLYRGNDWQPADIVADLQGLKATLVSAPPVAASPATKNSSVKAEPAKAAKLYHGVGVVESINDAHTTVEINHENIKDLMPAMSMAFEVKSAALLEGIAAGDRVSFTVAEMPHGLVIVELRKR
ncbi:MAG TPA: copper-binding protein [Blastocatellia bacterium]|nr:copper-binding protein [Blastocatellia bacterium]